MQRDSLSTYKLDGRIALDRRSSQALVNGGTLSLANNKQKKAYLLQGPIGPFFKNLQSELIKSGFKTKRILFHSADALFAPRNDVLRFSGDLSDWEKWFRSELALERPDVLLIFGTSRPAHKVACKLAQEFGIEIVSLEEGYLRSGYITCERGGNNHLSPLNQWKPVTSENAQQRSPLKLRSSFIMICLWGAIFYLHREFTKRDSEQYLYHRKTQGALKETISWVCHMTRRVRAKLSEKNVVRTLLDRHRKKYILVPLQTPSDAQIRIASRGWSNEKLVSECLSSVRVLPKGHLMVFKTHPLDENAHSLVAAIWSEAKRLGVADRVRVLQSGKLSDLTKFSSGMIVINSTSAFSALHHHVPVLVLGDAIFRHSSVVTVGNGADSIKAFIKCREAKPPQNITAFINAVKAKALLPGDFYALSAQSETARNVVATVERIVGESAGTGITRR